jgi:hypothetical protein
MNKTVKIAGSLACQWAIQAFTRWDLSWITKLGTWSEGERYAFIGIAVSGAIIAIFPWRSAFEGM